MAETQRRTPSIASSAPSSSPRSGWRWLLGCAVAVCVVGGASCYCYYRYCHSRKPSSSPAPSLSAASPHQHSAAHSLHPVVLFPQSEQPATAARADAVPYAAQTVPAVGSSTALQQSSRPSPSPLTAPFSGQAAVAERGPFSFLSDSAALSASFPATVPSSSSSLSSVTCRAWRCSSPGKALLTGGYLVLDSRYRGVVVALSARFHARVLPCGDLSILLSLATPSEPSLYAAHVGQPAQLPAASVASTSLRHPPQSFHPSRAPSDAGDGALTAVFVLHAPQRSGQLVEYWLRITADGGAGGAGCGVTAIQRHPTASEHNPFVLCSLFYSLHFLSAVLPPGLLRSKLASPVLLDVRGDHQFYSATPLPDNDPRWLRGKTGLGSSATLVSSLVGALCHYFQFTDDSTNGQLLLHAALLPHYASSATSSSFHQHSAGSSVTYPGRPASSLDSSFTVVGHDLSTFTFSSASLPVCSTLSLPRSARLAICHRLSQVAHCAAQGKVGSGFDVSAAYFGSQIYCRFSAACISHVVPDSLKQLLSIDRAALVQCLLPDIQHHQHQPTDSQHDSIERAVASSLPAASQSAPSSPSSAASPDSTSPSSSYSSVSELECPPSPITPPACSLCSAVRSRQHRWDERVSPLKLPSFLCVLLADVQGGAQTPGMVQQVLRWRTANPVDSSSIWDGLASSIAKVEQHLSALTDEQVGFHRETLARLADMKAGEWSSLLSSPPRSSDEAARNTLLHHLLQLRDAFVSLRAQYRLMGDAAAVSIEPRTQTELCDATMRVEGVLAAGVPGAGGEDAIFVLAVRHEKLTDRLERAWELLRRQHSARLEEGLRERVVRVLPVEQTTEGIVFDADSELRIDTLRLPVRCTKGT